MIEGDNVNDVFLDYKACFELVVQNNFDSESITDEIYRRNIGASYDQVFDNAFGYYQSSIYGSDIRKRYDEAYINYHNKIEEDNKFSETVYKYVNLNHKERDKYVDIDSYGVKRAARQFNVPKTRVLELYYQYVFMSRNLKNLPNNHQNEMTILRKYLFYVYVNHHFDATVFKYLPCLEEYSKKYNNFQEKLERILIPYLSSTCLLHITDGEKKYFLYMMDGHKQVYGSEVLNSDNQSFVLEDKKLQEKFNYLLSLSDEEMVEYYQNVDSKELKKWFSLGLKGTKYSRIYDNLVTFYKEMDEKARQIFLHDLENNEEFISMFSIVKKIIPCLEEDYIKLGDNLSKYLSREKFNYLDLRAITSVDFKDFYLFVHLLKRYDDGRFISSDKYSLVLNFLDSVNYDDKDLLDLEYLNKNNYNSIDMRYVFDLLRKWQIPLYSSVYDMALKRYSEGELEKRYYAFSNYGHSSELDLNKYSR